MKVLVVACALLSVAYAQTVPSTEQTILHECFEKDSISCVQQTVYRRAREFFDQPSIKLFAGIAFAKSNERAGKSLEPETKKIEEAATVQAREIALEDYLLERAKNFFAERSITWDVASAGRSISNAIPDEVKESVRELVTEGRTKKKILKKLIPILGLLKLKLAGLAVLAVAAIGIIAKKALITSFIAIALAGASLLGSVVAKLFSLGSGLASKGAGLGGLLGGAAGGLGGGGGGGGLGNVALSLGGLGGSGGLGGLGGLGGGGGGGLGGLGGLGGGGGGGNGAYNNANVEEIIAYNTGSSGGGGYNNGWNNNGWESYGEHGSHSQPVAQAIAYKGHHPNASRR